MNFAEIKKNDIANGLGVRVCLFVSGCTHRCEGCFNEIAWDFNYGQKFTQDTIDLIIEYLDKDYIQGLTLLGGEPFEMANQPMLLELVKQVKQKLPTKDIWAYSGYLFDDQLLGDHPVNMPNVTKQLLSHIDVLVDGKFVMDKKNLMLKFRGSSNQRIIDVQQSLQQNKVVLHPLN